MGSNGSICIDLHTTSHIHTYTVQTYYFAGNLISIICWKCNIKIQWNKTLFCLVHNACYDINLLLPYISLLTKKSPFIVANSSERITYMKFQSEICFVDSAQFSKSSLSAMTKKHVASGLPFPLLTEAFGAKADLLKQKLAFPYSYCNKFSVFDETELPSIEHFKDDLNDEPCELASYLHAKHIYQEFKCENIGQFSDLYLSVDVYLLCDTFLAFRQAVFELYELDCAQFISLSHLGYSAMLKMTGAVIELPTDICAYLMVESALRGGICSLAHSHAKANNEGCRSYNPNLPRSYLLYLDVNKLYGFSLSAPMPVGDFRFLSENEFSLESLLEMPPNGSEGFFIDADIEYPEEIHEETSDYPLLANQETILLEEQSPYQRSLIEKFNLSRKPSRKLVQSCRDQNNYVMHMSLFQEVVRLGLKVKRINAVLAFRQEAFIAPFITLHNDLCRTGTSLLSKDLAKLVINSIFGKSLYRVRNRKTFKLALDKTAYERYSQKLTVTRIKIIAENVALFSFLNNDIQVTSPLLMGACVLDVSKRWMLYTYYQIIKKTLSNVSFMYGDTDSWILYSTSSNFEAEMKLLADKILDTSNLPPTHYLASQQHCAKPGYYKDELAGAVLEEFVGLKPKQYSILTANSNPRRCKGIKRSVVAKNLLHEHYIKALKETTSLYTEQRIIQAHNNTNYTMQFKKRSLCPYESKRKWLSAFESVPYGYGENCQPPLPPSYFNTDL